MISMQGVPSSLILRNQSWVRKQAQALARHVPSNVEKADLIQVGLIAVAQASLTFEWEGDRDSPEARDAFVRYARMRVKGAMLDELRQMDHLGRAQRRKVKALEVARERHRAAHGNEPSAEQLGELCGISVDEVFELELAAKAGQSATLDDNGERDEVPAAQEPATPQDEVEARVDTGLLMRRLEKFFATLPERERQIIDAYLGVGLTPVQLAQNWNVSPSRVSQLFRSICERVGVHLGHAPQRSTDRLPAATGANLDHLIAQREAELASAGRGWGRAVEGALGVTPAAPSGDEDKRDDGVIETPDGRIVITPTTRWG